MRKNVQGFSGYISIICFPELTCARLTLEKQLHMEFEKSLVLYLVRLLYELQPDSALCFLPRYIGIFVHIYV